MDSATSFRTPNLARQHMTNMMILRALLAAVVVAASGCTDALSPAPHDALAPAAAWQSESDVQLALTGAYARMRESQFNGRAFAQSAMTDDAYSQNNYQGERDLVLGNISPTTGMVTSFYQSSYRLIGTYNEFLANAGNAPVSAAKLAQWNAEVRTLRAFFYSYLAELYGGVPIITAPYKMGDALIPRGSKDDVVKRVLDDLDSAIQNLPAKAYDGHVVKGTAQALKARVLLANRRFAESAAVGRQIIDSRTFRLYGGEYKQLFEAAGEANNPEIMLAVGYKSPNIEHDGTRASIWWTGIQPTQNLVDAFEMTDGKPITQSPLYNPQKPYENRDPRLYATVLVPGARMADEIWWVTYFGQGGVTQYNVWKIADRTVASSLGAGVHSENDPILIRYAEVLLNYAEAQNEAVGPDALAYAAVNEVRARVGMPSLPAGLSQAELRARIRNERRVELAFEPMHRYMDIVRWHAGVQLINGLKAGKGVTYVFADHNHLWPIPQSEVDYYKNNGSVMPQNPNY
jgi:hypothetical protein